MAAEDAIVSLAYQKRTSQRSQCEFHRDNGWAAVGAAGFEGVRQVAIDSNWSAIRFRRTESIKSLMRAVSRASSLAGQARAFEAGKKNAGPDGATANG